ncbi:DNA topoisomerase IB [Tenacibaculum sp. IB213877]|uniref:DNA topoisomerase IB n=1 Tax=Tenacibaculum sp. IB213877 TaxID=3097351 RepID=UPI002A59D052|nr:DNA topoisomerase IB [Tenacibaculum sp. IB213877]MDY0779340.1 DNA topoisomerase IB [Tenacibaculum sp. IB213877]
MYFRKKHGRGFTIKNNQGKTIKNQKIRSWINSLVIPPAWTEVEISEDPNADLLVTGRDDKNRKQYIYHPNYIEKRNQKKFDRIIDFADNLEHMRRVTGQHLRTKKMNRNKVLAVMVRLLETAFFRPGNEYYSSENNTYGLTTIRSKHLTIHGNEMIFTYTGKSNKEQEKHIVDARLTKIVQELDEIPGYEIFKYFDENNNKVDVKSDDLNAYIKEHMGEEFSAKDFRTWAGTIIAAIALDDIGAVDKKDQKVIDKNIKEAIVTVAEKLGNTPAVARSSYVDPRIVDEYVNGKTINYFKNEVDKLLSESKSLSREELGVLVMLKNSLKNN